MDVIGLLVLIVGAASAVVAFLLGVLDGLGVRWAKRRRLLKIQCWCVLINALCLASEALRAADSYKVLVFAVTAAFCMAGALRLSRRLGWYPS